MTVVSPIQCAPKPKELGAHSTSNICIKSLRGGRVYPCQRNLSVGSWDVEGYTNSKRIELQRYMEQENIGVLCLQETHKSKSDYYLSDEGYIIILSGGLEGKRENAGVGYMIAPWMQKSVVSFCQDSSRMAALKIRVRGGKMSIITAYAPHSGYDFADRQSFFHSLSEFVHKQSVHGPKLVFGDLNARLFRQLPGEEHLIGPYVFENRVAKISPCANRHLLVEFCTDVGMTVMNSFCDVPFDQKVSCYSIGHKPTDVISWASHSEIDFVLCEKTGISVY